MENREDALDFIYKGWREGRQQRRNVVRQRGLDRTRSMLGPIMAQRARGSMASMPPSMPVEETRVPTEPSPVENVEETVSMPPRTDEPTIEQTALAGSGRMNELRETIVVPEDDFSNDITNPTDHPDDLENEMVQPTPRENTPVLPSPVSKPVQPYAGQEEEERRIEEAKAEAAEARRKHKEELRAKEAEQPENVEQEDEKPPEHEKAFKEAYSAMEEEARNTDESAPSKEEQAIEMFRRVQNRKAEREGRDQVFEEDDSKLNEKSKEAMRMFETVQAAKKAREESKKPTQKDDPVLQQAAEQISSPPKATEKGKENVKRLGDTLAAYGMGFNDDKPDE